MSGEFIQSKEVNQDTMSFLGGAAVEGSDPIGDLSQTDETPMLGFLQEGTKDPGNNNKWKSGFALEEEVWPA